eukprot:jgi/Ulvmu1/1630/UM113_0007.1
MLGWQHALRILLNVDHAGGQYGGVQTPALASVVVTVVHAALLASKAAADAATAGEVVHVTTPVQFQEAVRTGFRHIVIRDHLDLTAAPPLSDPNSGRITSSVIAIAQQAGGDHTRTIRGNCTDDPYHNGLALHPEQRRQWNQCLVKVSGDFLEFAGSDPDSVLWLSFLYVLHSGTTGRGKSTLVGLHEGTMYLTDMTFVHGGTGGRVRAIDVHEQQSIYIEETEFFGFHHDNDAAVRLAPGSRATISDAKFVRNEVAHDIPTAAAGLGAVAAGPAIGLYGRDGGSGSAACLWNCTFDSNSAPVAGQVAVETRACRVFSNRVQPSVWDRKLSRTLEAWPLRPAWSAGAAGGMPPDQKGFPRPTDALFQQLVQEQVAGTDLPAPALDTFPNVSDMRTADPYKAAGIGVGNGQLATGVLAAISVAAVLVLVLLLLAAAAVILRQLRLRRKGKLPEGSQGGHSGKQQSGNDTSITGEWSGQASSALAGRGSWYTRTRSSLFTRDTWSQTCASTLPARPPPRAGASRRELREYLQHQLDLLAGKEFLPGLVLLGGPSNRVCGGQAVIQFAKDRRTDLHYAAKFFLSTSAFADESGLYTNPSTPLGPFLPALRNIMDGSSAASTVVDGHGYPLPPCIVMEKGESLDVWMQRNRGGVDMITGLQVIQHVAERLVDLHGAGYVHRDLKFSNVIWLPRENRWTLIDFGCAAAIGETAPLSFTLQYAPPEVVQAMRAGRRTIRAQSSMDAWSLGIIAWELFCNRAALDIFEGKDVTVARIMGEKPLPWEAETEVSKHSLHQLGRFRPAVLGLLQRDAEDRLAIPDFISRCRRVIEKTRTPASGT